MECLGDERPHYRIYGDDISSYACDVAVRVLFVEVARRRTGREVPRLRYLSHNALYLFRRDEPLHFGEGRHHCCHTSSTCRFIKHWLVNGFEDDILLAQEVPEDEIVLHIASDTVAMHHIDRLYLLLVDEVYKLLHRRSVHILAAFALVFERREWLLPAFVSVFAAHPF